MRALKHLHFNRSSKAIVMPDQTVSSAASATSRNPANGSLIKTYAFQTSEDRETGRA